MTVTLRARWRIVATLAALLVSAPAAAQLGKVLPAAAEPAQPQQDSLGRDTPRGTLIGFMSAAAHGNLEAAALYLNADPRDRGTQKLAQQLYVVLDARLPPRLNAASDRPEGSQANPLKPDQDVVGTIATDDGPLDLIVQRVTSGTSPPVWLFSEKTLDAIGPVYAEVHVVSVARHLPGMLTHPRIAGVRLFQWLVFFIAIPLLYRAIGLLGLLLAPLQARWRRRHNLPPQPPLPIPGPVRLLLLAVGLRLVVVNVDLSLFERVFWTVTARILSTTSIVWMGLWLNDYGERYVRRRLSTSRVGEVAAILRLARRTADALVLVAGGLVILRVFGVDPTAALAGLGIGGIAVALAAQKTLENLIGGLSIVFDKAVRVGDFLKIGDTSGTVDSIGLRSTRIRTADRTILTLPNGVVANANIETFSLRDKFWFHHYIGLSYATTAAQMRGIVGDIATRLREHPRIDPTVVRARFLRLSASSIDIEVFAYLFARDWDQFLELQESLLLEIMEIVERRGATIAFPSQTLYVADGSAPPALSRARAGTS